jgi:hypothetical protein
MLHRHLATLSAALLASVAAAGPIDQQTAAKIASDFLSARKAATTTVEAVRSAASVKDRNGRITTTEPFYAFNAQDGNGFVLVSSDDNMQPILGYSTTGTFGADIADMPDALRAFLDQFADYTNDVRAGRAEAPNRASGVSTGTIIVQPILTCTWTQEQPYNNYLPREGTEPLDVGCVATAISQVMYKWQWPNRGRGSVSYNSKYGVLTSNFADSTYNWSILKDSYRNTLIVKRSDSGKELAKINRDAGISVRMDYTPEGSGSHSEWAMRALVEHFRYKSSTIRLHRRRAVATQDEWFNIVRKDLDAGRPVICGATSKTGSGRDVGHEFVFDGYDSNRFIHVNWGWAGSGNGYYDLALLDVYNYQYSLNQDLITGIIPDYDDNDGTKPQTRYDLFASRPTAIGAVTASTPRTNYKPIASIALGANFSISIDTVANINPWATTTNVGYGLFDLNDNLLEVIGENTNSEYKNLGAYNYIPTYLPVSCSIKGTYKAGDYRIRLITQESGYTDWVFPFITGGHSLNAIPAYIHDGQAYFNQVSTGISAISAADANLLRSDYYDLTGRRLAAPQHGQIVIRRDTYGNGSIRTTKVRY